MYRTLHRIALECLRSERDPGSLGPTALVHEAYLRFATSQKIAVNDRAHFLALAARVMRRIIVDRARARKSGKRGGNNQPIELSDTFAGSAEDADQVLAVDVALEKRRSAETDRGCRSAHCAWRTFPKTVAAAGANIIATP